MENNSKTTNPQLPQQSTSSKIFQQVIEILKEKQSLSSSHNTNIGQTHSTTLSSTQNTSNHKKKISFLNLSPDKRQFLSTMLTHLAFFQPFQNDPSFHPYAEKCAEVLDLQIYPPGTPVFLFGERGDSVYFILSGQAAIYIPKTEADKLRSFKLQTKFYKVKRKIIALKERHDILQNQRKSSYDNDIEEEQYDDDFEDLGNQRNQTKNKNKSKQINKSVDQEGYYKEDFEDYNEQNAIAGVQGMKQSNKTSNNQQQMLRVSSSGAIINNYKNNPISSKMDPSETNPTQVPSSQTKPSSQPQPLLKTQQQQQQSKLIQSSQQQQSSSQSYQAPKQHQSLNQQQQQQQQNDAEIPLKLIEKYNRRQQRIAAQIQGANEEFKNQTDKLVTQAQSPYIYRVVHICRQGAQFGELSVLFNKNRTATVAAFDSELCVLQIKGSDYLRIFKDLLPRLNFNLYCLEQAFPGCRKSLLATLSNCFSSQVVRFKLNDSIYLEGKVSDRIYLLKKGTVEFRKIIGEDQISGREIIKDIHTINEGELFGQEAMLLHNPLRYASAVSTYYETEVIFLPKIAFNKVVQGTQEQVDMRKRAVDFLEGLQAKVDKIKADYPRGFAAPLTVHKNSYNNNSNNNNNFSSSNFQQDNNNIISDQSQQQQQPVSPVIKRMQNKQKSIKFRMEKNLLNMDFPKIVSNPHISSQMIQIFKNGNSTSTNSLAHSMVSISTKALQGLQQRQGQESLLNQQQLQLGTVTQSSIPLNSLQSEQLNQDANLDRFSDPSKFFPNLNCNQL